MSIQLTKNQKHILDLLQKQKTEISAQQLHHELRQEGFRIGLATVYRTLKSLHLKGVLQERVTSAGESLYRCLSEDQHPDHHLNCVRCGRSIPLEDCPISKQLTLWCKSQDFKIYYHTLEVFGLCHLCQNLINTSQTD